MAERGLDRAEFRDLVRQMLKAGHNVRFQASGESMQPFVRSGDILLVAPADQTYIRLGNIVLAESSHGRLLAHRVVRSKGREGRPVFLLKGDACKEPDGWFLSAEILGRVEWIERGDQKIRLTSLAQDVRASIWVIIFPWIPKFQWLPAGVRRTFRNWLTGS